MTPLLGRPGDRVGEAGPKPPRLSFWAAYLRGDGVLPGPTPGLGEGWVLGGGEAVTPHSWPGEGHSAHSSRATPKFNSRLRASQMLFPLTVTPLPASPRSGTPTSLGLGALLSQLFLPE